MNPFEPPRSGTESPRLASGKLTPVTCPACRADFEAGKQRTFLGFPKYACPECRAEFKAPLSTRRRVLYWALLAGAALVALAAGPETRAQPSIFVLLMALAVLLDIVALIRRR
jgi:hypothetical protein